MDVLEKIYERICEAYRAGDGLALFFDYDGTLAPLRPTPEEAVLPPPVRKALMRLRDMPNVSISIISGRSLVNLRQMVDMENVFLSGTSGVEVDLGIHPSQGLYHLAVNDNLNAIAEALRPVATRYAGAWIERKPLGLTLHYRAVHPELAGPLRDDARNAVEAWKELVKVDDVTMGIEIIPRLGRDKGTAVREILQAIGGEPYCAYFGDAANDGPGFEAIESLNGLSIGVGPEAPPASLHITGPEQVSLILTMFASSLANSKQTNVCQPSLV